MNLKLLKTLADIHAISGNEENIENFLVNFAKKYNLPFQLNKGYGVVIGNPKASIYCIAHTDEVGGIITAKKDNKLKFEGIGRVKPCMFIGRNIEIKTKNNKLIYGIVIGTKPLKIDFKGFGDIDIIVDSKDIQKVSVGDYLRFKIDYIKRTNSIFSNALDNRVGVFALLEYILKNKDEKKIFENIAFCFAGEEEIKNKGAKYYMNKYLPKNILIFDVIPESFIINNYSTNTFILNKTLDYTLSKNFNFLKNYQKVSYIDLNMNLLKNSEPYQYEKITSGKAINILCPIYNYHSGTYLLEKEALNNYLEFTNKVINEIGNIEK